MTPTRKISIGAHLVEEFYWNGKTVVYVNGKFREGSYLSVCSEVEGKS